MHPSRVTRRTVAAVVVIWAVAWLCVLRAPGDHRIALAAAFDFTITAGAAMWFFQRRLTVPILAIGLAMAKLVAPGMVVAILLEVVSVAWLYSRRSRVAKILTTELRLLRALITGWKQPTDGFRIGDGWPLYAGVLVFLSLVEAVGVHVALHPPWWVTALSVYGALWLVADALAIRQTGLFIRGDQLELRIGERWHATMPLADVSIVAPTPAALDLSIVGANLALSLAKPVTLTGLFGRTRTTQLIALAVDDPTAFTAAVTRARPSDTAGEGHPVAP